MASENSYAQLLDDYEDGIEVIEGETFDEYQKRMGGIDYNAYGGLTGMSYANGGGVGSMMQQKKNFKMQGGVRNYLGDQKQVKAPLNWQSSPDHPKTELAYITKKEKDLLIKKDLHNSLNGSANKGPSGIISLNGFGSTDRSQNVSGAAASAAETNSSNARDRAEVRAAFAGPGPSLAPGVTPKGAQDFRDAFINAGAGQRVNPGFFDSRTFLSPTEIARAKGYRNDPNNIFAKKSFRNTGQSGIMNFIRSGGLMGNLVRGLGQKFGLGKRYDDTSTSISENFNNNLGLDGINPATYDFDPNAKINQNVDTTGFSRFSNKSLGNTNSMPKANITGMNNITGGMAPNDYDVGNLGINNNDYEIGNPGQYATADMINEFGDGRMGNINDEFGYSPEFQAGLTNEFGESPEFNVSQINEFGQSPEFNAGLVNEFGQSPEFNTSLINEFGQSPGFQGIGETVANNIINSDIAPQFQDLVSQAKVSEKDIQNSKMRGFGKQTFDDYQTQENMLSGGTQITPFELDALQKGYITKPGTYTGASKTKATEEDFARNGGIMGYGRG